MDAGFQNEHERLIHGMSQGVFGSWSVYRPEKWQSGPGVDEPADLVALGRNVVVLCFLHHSKAGKSPQRTASDFEYGVRHNLVQARGSLRNWRTRGLPIECDGPGGPRSIRYEGQSVCVLSVVDGDPSVWRGVYHYAEEAELSVDACCTLPGSVVSRAAAEQLTLIDLLLLVRFLWRERREVPEPELIERLERSKRDAWCVSGAIQFWPQPDEELRWRLAWLGSMRTTKNHTWAVGDLNASDFLPEFVNDLPLADLLGFLVAASRLTNETRDPGREGAMVFRCQRHDVPILAVHGMPNRDRLGEMLASVTAWQRSWLMRPGPAFVLLKDFPGSAMVVGSSTGGPSHAAQLCRMAERAALQAPFVDPLPDFVIGAQMDRTATEHGCT